MPMRWRALRLCLAYGNVLELRSRLILTAILADGDVIHAQDLALEAVGERPSLMRTLDERRHCAGPALGDLESAGSWAWRLNAHRKLQRLGWDDLDKEELLARAEGCAGVSHAVDPPLGVDRLPKRLPLPLPGAEEPNIDRHLAALGVPWDEEVEHDLTAFTRTPLRRRLDGLVSVQKDFVAFARVAVDVHHRVDASRELFQGGDVEAESKPCARVRGVEQRKPIQFKPLTDLDIKIAFDSIGEARLGLGRAPLAAVVALVDPSGRCSCVQSANQVLIGACPGLSAGPLHRILGEVVQGEGLALEVMDQLLISKAHRPCVVVGVWVGQRLGEDQLLGQLLTEHRRHQRATVPGDLGAR